MLIAPSYHFEDRIEINSGNQSILDAIKTFFATKISEITTLGPSHSIDVQFGDHKVTKSEISTGKNIRTYFDEETVLLKSKEGVMKILFMNNVLLTKNEKNINLTVQEYNSEAEVLIQQVIRSVVEKTLFDKGYGVLHGGSFELNNEGYIILGEKGDGKTTTLSQALYQRNASFVSNDRVFFKQNDNGNLHLINREQHIRVGERTALDIPVLEEYIKKVGVQKDSSGKFYINDLPYLIGAIPRNETVVNHIVLPNFTKEKNFFNVTPIEMINQSKIVDAKGFQLYNTLFGTGFTNNYLFSQKQLQSFNPHIHKGDGVETIDYLVSSL